MSKVTLISNKICPYARKAHIAIREKTSEFKLVEEDLQNKSEFFKESYAKSLGRTPGKEGAVPVIIDEDTYFAQSEPIVWHIAEKYQNEGYDILPQNHIQKFKVRLFVQEFVKKLIPLQGKYFGWGKKSQEDQKKQKQQALQFLQSLNQKLILPYALGEQFTIADILIYPHLELWGAIETFTGSGIDVKFEKVHKYVNEIQKRNSVKELIQSKQTYAEALKKFF